MTRPEGEWDAAEADVVEAVFRAIRLVKEGHGAQGDKRGPRQLVAEYFKVPELARLLLDRLPPVERRG